MVLPGPGLLLEALSGSMALLQLPSLVRSVAPVATESSEDRPAKICPCLSLTTAFGRMGPAPQLGGTLELTLLMGLWVI